MSPWKATQPGDPVSAIAGRRLMRDLDAVERNRQRRSDALRGSKVRRP